MVRFILVWQITPPHITPGVVDAENYYAGLWSNNLLDTDETLHTILGACADAGPSLCALHESTTEKVHARLTAIFDALKRRPLPVYSNITGKEYGLVDYKLARLVLFTLLYAPYGSTFYRNAKHPSMDLLHALADVEKGDGLALGRLAGIVPANAPFSCSCPGEPHPPVVDTPDTTIAILCADAEAARGEDTVEDLEEHFRKMSEGTEFANMWPIRTYCS